MRKKTKLLVAGMALVALLVPTFAIAAGEGGPLQLGERNPSSNESQSLSKETEIIATTSTYGTRQSNKSDNGGGAIYGCRSKAGGTAQGNEPCIRANNLADGSAFELETNGTLGGAIVTKAGDGSKPFVTNATGVATGLNADRVDSKSSDDLTKDAVAAVAGQIRIAAVSSTGQLGAARGIASASRTAEGTYQVVFAADASGCAFQATETTTEDAGAASVGLGDDKKTLTVRTRSGAGTVADRPFHLTATCL